MPHVIIRLWPGRSDEVKSNLAKTIALDIAKGLNVEMGDVSVAFEEVSRNDWGEQVYKKEIKDNTNVYLKPEYEY